MSDAYIAFRIFTWIITLVSMMAALSQWATSKTYYTTGRDHTSGWVLLILIIFFIIQNTIWAL
jgi:hypothetical protein